MIFIVCKMCVFGHFSILYQNFEGGLAFDKGGNVGLIEKN